MHLLNPKQVFLRTSGRQSCLRRLDLDELSLLVVRYGSAVKYRMVRTGAWSAEQALNGFNPMGGVVKLSNGLKHGGQRSCGQPIKCIQAARHGAVSSSHWWSNSSAGVSSSLSA